MTDIIILALLAIILGSAGRYVYKAKKNGAKCIGCSVGEGGCCCSSAGGETTSDCGCGCGCHTDTQ